MSTTSPPISILEVNPILLFMTPERPGEILANNTYNTSTNVTGGNGQENIESYYNSYTLYKVTYYVAEYYLWVVLAFGVPGNLASIFTILSMTTVSSSKVHVAILALTDTIAIISKVFYWQASGHSIQLTSYGCTLTMFVQQFSTVYANWVVVAMTSERFLAVWFPLKVGRIYTRRKAVIVLTCFAILTAAVYIFFFWAWTELHTEEDGYWCQIKQEYLSFVNDSFYWIDGIYYAILPCILVLTGNTLIVTNIKRAMKIQRHLTNTFDQGARKSRDQKQITVMLFVVSVIFLLLNMPNAIFYIVKPYWTFQTPSYEHVKYQFTTRFIHLLSDANHAVNFYLYFLSMSSFRRRFMDAIRCRGNKYRPPASSVSRTTHTSIHSVHHISDHSRRTKNGRCYSGYKRSSKKLERPLILETYKSNSNGSNYGQRIQDSRQSLDAVSEV